MGDVNLTNVLGVAYYCLSPKVKRIPNDSQSRVKRYQKIGYDERDIVNSEIELMGKGVLEQGLEGEPAILINQLEGRELYNRATPEEIREAEKIRKNLEKSLQ